MRDESFVEDEATLASPGLMQRLRAGAGAVLALAALSALVVWGYRLSARDPSDVPVIRRMAGEARIAPEEPQGAVFPYAEREVYDAVAGPAPRGEAALAPPPERLAAEDVPAAPAQPAAAPAPSSPAEPAPLAPAPAPTVETAEAAATPAPAQPAAGPEPVAPANEIEALVRQVVVRPAAPAPPPPRPGGVSVQLGAYLSEADAWANWKALQRRIPVLQGHSARLAPITHQGRPLQALRVTSVSNSAQARDLCAAIKAREGGCFLVGGG